MVSSYRDLLIRGLQQGLVKQDLARMRSQGRYFSSPVQGNTLLLRIRMRLMLLRLRYGFLTAKKNQKLRDVLLDLEQTPAEQWNPSLSPMPISILSEAPSYQLEFYVIPSPLGFDWSTPRGLLWSLRNYAIRSRNHKIGHAMVILKKDGEVAAATGMTGETNLQVFFDIVFRCCGLDVLFRTFRGRLETLEFVCADIKRHQAKGLIEQLHFPLEKKQFDRCMEHLNEWCERGRYQNYGLTFDVLALNGASCTSYALTYLKLAGLITKEHEREWVRTVQIPKWFFKTPGRPLGLFKLLILLLKEKQWRALDPGDLQTVRFWDPDLICQWIREHGKVPQRLVAKAESRDSGSWSSSVNQ